MTRSIRPPAASLSRPLALVPLALAVLAIAALAIAYALTLQTQIAGSFNEQFSP